MSEILSNGKNLLTKDAGDTQYLPRASFTNSAYTSIGASSVGSGKILDPNNASYYIKHGASLCISGYLQLNTSGGSSNVLFDSITTFDPWVIAAGDKIIVGSGVVINQTQGTRYPIDVYYSSLGTADLFCDDLPVINGDTIYIRFNAVVPTKPAII